MLRTDVTIYAFDLKAERYEYMDPHVASQRTRLRVTRRDIRSQERFRPRKKRGWQITNLAYFTSQSRYDAFR